MASLQAYQSHGIPYYRIVESFRNNGKPSIRVLAHLGRVDDILQRHQQQQEVPVRVSSVSAGAVTAIHHLAQELDLAGRINRAISPDGDVQVRDALTVGESLVAAMIARACAPRSKRAFADWAKTTYLPDLMHFTSSNLTSQHFWDQMNALPVEKLAIIEQELVREVVRIEQLHLQALAYDTTNFYTHIASTNLRPTLPQRGKNKQGRHDLRQMGLALVVDQVTQLPLAHVLYEGCSAASESNAKWLDGRTAVTYRSSPSRFCRDEAPASKTSVSCSGWPVNSRRRLRTGLRNSAKVFISERAPSYLSLIHI